MIEPFKVNILILEGIDFFCAWGVGNADVEGVAASGHS